MRLLREVKGLDNGATKERKEKEEWRDKQSYNPSEKGSEREIKKSF